MKEDNPGLIFKGEIKKLYSVSIVSLKNLVIASPPKGMAVLIFIHSGCALPVDVNEGRKSCSVVQKRSYLRLNLKAHKIYNT